MPPSTSSRTSTTALHALADRGNLVLTTATDEDGAVLVQHAYVAARARSYMLYSASVLAQSA